MRTKYKFHIITLLILFSSLIPTSGVGALPMMALPPVDMFQLPWEQGLSWISLDGIDNGFKRGLGSPHNYLNGGAIDFAPSVMNVGDDTSNAWVTAAAAGTIVDISPCHLKIDHHNGWTSEYQFLANFQVQLGDSVYRNQRLAIIADGERDPFCPPALLPDIPHVHFSVRPTMIDASFAGWLVNYSPILNRTSFTKNGQTVESYEPLLNMPNPQVVLREEITWDILYTGSVDPALFERWPFVLLEENTFSLTATPITAGLEPWVILLDANGHELDRGVGALSSTQPAGNYFVQIEPRSGDGFYNLILERVLTPDGPHVIIDAPTTIEVGETAEVGIYLGDVPPGGYTSAEFSCTYDANIIEVSNILATDLFGTNPAVALNGPQGGNFIAAIAGTNGQRATTNGNVFTFSATGLQEGQTMIACLGRVSIGDGILTELPSVNATLTVLGAAPAAAPMLQLASFTPTSPVLKGKIVASKPTTLNLYAPDNVLAATVLANADGTFELTAPAGVYTVVAEASGFLKTQTAITLNAGETFSLPSIDLTAGDVDNNGVIDQFDAITLGMSYNTASPDAADLNADGIINFLDLEAIANNYRATGPRAWE